MGFFQLKTNIELRAEIDEVWEFISNPVNLKKITPDYMGFDITSGDIPDKIYEGLIVSYIVAPVFGIKTQWVTEITHVREKEYFVDEQRVGPYRMWHHQHFISKTDKGTRMTDIVSYKPPFGYLGTVANSLLIRRKLNGIFEYRSIALADLFGII
ncbi:MAG: SRPBCC family protein [Marinilabiliaceae bacterium]|jgi:ligand-binding SRPBCC domain-containing protein|nr:SRPBCC family protein [Marinilabiliaceae bacterium]